MRIDVHAHHFPTEYLEVLDRHGSRATETARRSPGFHIGLDERIGMMDDAGIDMQVLSVGPQLPYFDDRDAAVEAARFANDCYAEVAQKYPGRFKAFATVPLPHVDEAIRELDRATSELGTLGVGLGCSIKSLPLDAPELDPFFAELNRREAVLFLHPVGAGAGPNSEDYGLTWMIGAPFEDTIAALRLVLSGTTEKYPNIKIIVPHLGGTVPFLMQRLDDAAQRQRAIGTAYGIKGDPSELMKKLWYDTVNGHGPALRCSCDSYGADRLMLGTDFPYLVGPKFKHCVTYVEQAGLPDHDVRAILDRNAQELLLGL